MHWTLAILILAQFCSSSLSFLFWRLPQDESQLVVVQKYNEQCQWFNSGLMGLIPRTFNRTTICRCKFIGLYECSTLTVHKSNRSEVDNLSSTLFHLRKFKAPAPPPAAHNSTLSSKDKDDNSLSTTTTTTTTNTMDSFPHFSQATSMRPRPLLEYNVNLKSDQKKSNSTTTTGTTSSPQEGETTAN